MRHQRGFAIITVLFILALIGGALLLLGDASISLQETSQQAYAQACKRNLTASGLAWLEKNAPSAGKADFTAGIELDAKYLHGQLLKVAPTHDGKYEITTACRSGQLILKSSETFAPTVDAR